MSKQTTLFDRHREETHAVAQPPAQEAELQRVTSRIGHCVIAFIQERGGRRRVSRGGPPRVCEARLPSGSSFSRPGDARAAQSKSFRLRGSQQESEFVPGDEDFRGL